MLSNEVRRRLVAGYERTHNAKEVAECYGVTEREVYKLAAQMRETGSVDLRTNRCGRKPKLSSEEVERVDKTIQEQPDITLREIIEKLHLDIRAIGVKIFTKRSIMQKEYIMQINR